jgi:hypothetical protein
LLVPKLLGKRRVSHVSDLCTDEGTGLFAGLNVLPKTTYATAYSYQTERPMNERLIDELTRRMPLKEPPLCFNLDFHAIPFRGQKADLENHWVPKSHRGQPAVMAFVAQEAERRVIADFRSLITLVNSTHIFQILAAFSLALALVSSRYYQY